MIIGDQPNLVPRSQLQRQDTLTKAVVAALEVTSIIVTTTDDRDQTVRDLLLEPDCGECLESDLSPLVDTSIFDVLSDFTLDLCLSRPASPTPSIPNLPPSTPSPPISPTLSRSMSFTSVKATTVTKNMVKKKFSRLSSTVPARSRGSWPLIKYSGRGTPIDPQRRQQWGGLSTEEVAEDGLLFTPDIRRSEESFLVSPSIAPSLSSHPHSLKRAPSVYEPPPELGPLEIESSSVRRSAEWDHIMKSVLATTTEEGPDIDETTSHPANAVAEEILDTTLPLNFSIMSREQVEELNSGLEAELGINAALDLEFGQERNGGSKWFDLNLVQLSGNGSRASSPSVYSSQVVTVRKRSPEASRASGHKSLSSVKVEDDISATTSDPKLPTTTPWWRRMFGRFRRAQSLFTISKTLL